MIHLTGSSLRRWLRGGTLCAMSLLGIWRGANAQRCEDCLSLVPYARLSTAAAPILPSRTQTIVRTSANHFVISYFWRRPPQIVLFDSAGTALAVYDRSGQGPGEFRYSPLIFAGNRDTIYALEDDRLVRLSARLEHIDTKPIATGITSKAAVLSSGLVVVDRIPRDAGTTIAVSLLALDGTLARYVGTVPDRNGGPPVVARASDGGFWTLTRNGSELKRYSADAQLTRTVQVATPWFEPWSEPIRGEGREVKPRSRRVVVNEIANDTLLVLTWVADGAWAPEAPGTPLRPASEDHGRVYDTIVELVDARSGNVIAEQRYPQALSTVDAAGDLLFSTEEDADGHIITQIWQAVRR